MCSGVHLIIQFAHRVDPQYGGQLFGVVSDANPSSLATGILLGLLLTGLTLLRRHLDRRVERYGRGWKSW